MAAVDSTLTCSVYVAHDLSGSSLREFQPRAEIVARTVGLQRGQAEGPARAGRVLKRGNTTSDTRSHCTKTSSVCTPTASKPKWRGRISLLSSRFPESSCLGKPRNERTRRPLVLSIVLSPAREGLALRPGNAREFQ